MSVVGSAQADTHHSPEHTNQENFRQLDLSGKLIIKVRLGDDVRRIPIHNEDITFDELVLMMQRVYRGRLSSTDEVLIKYQDEDGDLITLFDSSDLSFAIQCSRILKITLFVNGGPAPLETNEVKHIRQELQHLRDRVNILLDRLDASHRTTNTGGAHNREVSNEKDGATTSVESQRNSTSPAPKAAVGGKEFDPLSGSKTPTNVMNGTASPGASTQNKVMSSFGLSGQNTDGTSSGRPGTPDSVSSIGSSASHSRQQQQAHMYSQQQQMKQQYPTQQQQAATGQPQAPASSQQQQPSQNATAFPATGTASAPGGQPAAQPTGQHTGQPGYPQNTQTAPGQTAPGQAPAVQGAPTQQYGYAGQPQQFSTQQQQPGYPTQQQQQRPDGSGTYSGQQIQSQQPPQQQYGACGQPTGQPSGQPQQQPYQGQPAPGGQAPTTQAQGYSGQPGAPPNAAAAAGNPYSRGPAAGYAAGAHQSYPRPQQQY